MVFRIAASTDWQAAGIGRDLPAGERLGAPAASGGDGDALPALRQSLITLGGVGAAALAFALLHTLVSGQPRALVWLLGMGAGPGADAQYLFAEDVLKIHRHLREKGIELYVTGIKGRVRDTIYGTRLEERIGKDHFAMTPFRAIKRIRHQESKKAGEHPAGDDKK